MTNITVRFAHYHTHAQIMELEVEPSATIGALRTMLEQRLAEDDYSMMRVFFAWYLEVKLSKDRKTYCPIRDADKEASLSSMGLEDCSVVYLEGPLTDSWDGVGKALAFVVAETREHAQLLSQGMADLKENITDLKEGINGVKTQMEDLTKTDQKLCSSLVIIVADRLLVKHHPDQPLQAFWEALTSSAYQEDPNVAMAIVDDPRCGIDRCARMKKGNRGFLALRKHLSSTHRVVATPIILAAFAGRADVLERLWGMGAGTQEKKNVFTALHAAAAMGHVEVIALLIAKGEDPKVADKHGSTPLHHAASNGHAAAIEALIAKGADPKAVDKDGSTPLHKAAYNGHVEAIEALVAKGADPKAVDKDGSTPMHKAACNGHFEAMEALIAKGADPKVADNNGSTPLHKPACNGHFEAIEALVAKFADIKAVNNSGSTPLHHAASNGHAEAIEALVAKGADIKAADKSGQLPRDKIKYGLSHDVREHIIALLTE